MLNKDSILAAADLPTEKVPCPEWGGDVYVRTMAGHERDHFEQSVADGKSKSNLNNVRARLAVKTVCDDKGNRLFTDDDAEALGKKSGKVLDRIFDAAQRLNGIGKEAENDIAKNSAAAPSGSSTSSSPAPGVAASASCSPAPTPASLPSGAPPTTSTPGEPTVLI
jgi:Phage tail assembly chaperone